MKDSSWLPTILKTQYKYKGLDSENNMIGILSFEVSRLMSKVANLWHCLNDRQISRLNEELGYSLGIRTLISDNHAYLIDLALEEITDNLKGVAISVARLGKRCLDPVYHNLDNVFDNPFEIDLKWCGWEYRLTKMEKRVKKMKKFTAVMSKMHEELEVLSVLETKFTKMHSNGAGQGKIMQELHQAVMWRQEEVSRLRKRSPWVRSYDHIVRLLLRTLFTIVNRIKVVFGITTGMPHGSHFTRFSVYPSEGSFRTSVLNPGHPATCSFRVNDAFQNDVSGPIKKDTFSLNSKEATLGKSGLALVYANIIIYIETLATSPRFISSDARDNLYDMLTTNIKQSLRKKLLLSKKEASFAYDESIALDRRSSVQRILYWLSPLAHNLIKWYAERDFEKQPIGSGGNVLLVQTLYYADQEASETAITELIIGLHYLSKYTQEIIHKYFMKSA